MEIETILILIWALIMTVTLGILVVVLLNLKKKHDQDILHKEDEIQEMNEKLEQKQSKSFQLGVNATSGDYSEILGDFALLSKYDSIITLSTTSKKPSLDLIGVNEESLDFLEIKKKGAKTSVGENHVRRLVEEKKVSYKVFDIELPDGFTLEERELKKLKDKKK
jgi:predicted Holliday junction resolvase-like endonuclease